MVTVVTRAGGGAAVPTVTFTTGFAFVVPLPVADILKVYLAGCFPAFTGRVTSWAISPLQGVAAYGIPVITLLEVNTHVAALATVADRGDGATGLIERGGRGGESGHRGLDDYGPGWGCSEQSGHQDANEHHDHASSNSHAPAFHIARLVSEIITPK